jgi:hypothetical protein
MKQTRDPQQLELPLPHPCANRENTKTRRRIETVYLDTLRAWAHGEPTDAAAVHSQIDAILDDFAAAVSRAAAHKFRLEAE